MGDVLTLRVRGVRVATPSSRILRLDLHGQPFVYHAGQAAIIGLAGQPHRKPYSIACAPVEAARSGFLEFLIKVGSSGGAGPHLTLLNRGTSVDLEGPVGSFQLPDGAANERLLFIAGGTGIAPLRAMLWQALLTGKPQAVGVLYSARCPREFAYGTELRRLGRAGRIQLSLTVTRDAGPRWRGDRGRINLPRLKSLISSSETLCFLCGPPSLLHDVPPLLRQLGIPPSRIQMEAP